MCFPANFAKILRKPFFYRTTPGDCFLTLLDKIAYKNVMGRVSLVDNKQNSKTSKLKTSTPLTKPKKLVTINVEIKTSDDKQSLKRVRGA